MRRRCGGKVVPGRQQKRASGSREDGKVERGFNSQDESHSSGQRKQQQAMQTRNEPGVTTEDQCPTLGKLLQGGDPNQGRYHGWWNEPVELGGVGREVGEVSKGRVGQAISSPPRPKRCNGGKKGDAQRQPRKHGTVVFEPFSHLARRHLTLCQRRRE